MKVSNFVSPRHNASGAQPVIDSFRVNEVAISSVHHRLNAFEVLMVVSPQLRLSGFSTAFTEGLKSKKTLEMRADAPQRSLVCKFDAVNWNSQTALVIHAGRGLNSNLLQKQFSQATANNYSIQNRPGIPDLWLSATGKRMKLTALNLKYRERLCGERSKDIWPCQSSSRHRRATP